MRAALFLVASLLLLASPCLLTAQDDPDMPPAPIPQLRHTAHSAAEFAPANWKVEREAKGDLNGDGRADLAFVLHETNKALIVHTTGFGVEELDTNPRLLGLAFANADGTYTLAAQNGKVITRWTEANMEDYFEEGGLEIKRGAVAVTLHTFANAGSRYTGDITLTFRWQHSRFELIGYENTSTHRATLEVTTTSVNYSTGVAVVTRAPEKGRTTTRRKQLPNKPLLALQDVGSGIDFEAP